MKVEYTFDAYANSAGQDNTTKILTAMTFLKKMKDSLKENYRGSILLIDEIDATLFASSQVQLLKELRRFAEEENVQVIATTHSLEMLKYASDIYSKNQNSDIGVCYLHILAKKVKAENNPDWNFIQDNLQLLEGEGVNIPKITVFREDDVAQDFLRNLLSSTLRKNLEFAPGDFSYSTLAKLSKCKIAFFEKAIYIGDGDATGATTKAKNYICLPTCNTRPESAIIKFIRDIGDSDDEAVYLKFFKKSGFTAQKFFQGFTQYTNDKNRDKTFYNKLTADQKNKAIKLWAKDAANNENVAKFVKKFLELYNNQAIKAGCFVFEA